MTRTEATQDLPDSRRQFLSHGGKAALIAALGAPVPFIDNLAPGVMPEALAQVVGEAKGKRGIRVLNDRPFNAETPVTLLDDDITPNERHFVRNNGIVPERAWKKDLKGWSLQIDGEVGKELNLSMSDLKARFKSVRRTLVIECGGNGRAGYDPPAKGNQWTLGAVGCAEYEGVRLRDVLNAAGVKKSAVYIGYYGEDIHLSRDPRKQPISRGVPIAKALDEHTILAWSMNGEPLPAYHGFPLRLVCPGWPGSTGGKWLKRIWVRDQVHDGTKMTGTAYRVPRHPVAPGTDVAEEDMEIIHEMPVKSIITRPGTGIETPLAKQLALRGHAWSGWGDVKAMDLSIDFGATWISAKLGAPRNPYAWQRWNVQIKFPKPGYYEVWARATDNRGHMQPMLVPGWNPKGYLNNAMQRIAVKVVA
ncbi:MAG: molybdopterin containing oxidoreductase [Verrucomicrobiales bacterium]|nr:molybdopterin containing oxidoreductase [Verrucomicrobiales bacterium]